VLDRFPSPLRGGVRGGGAQTATVNDKTGERLLNDRGLRLLRAWSFEVHENVEGAMDTMVAVLRTPTPDPSPRRVEDTPSA
jgi:very-short-patch-repair endonuclease